MADIAEDATKTISLLADGMGAKPEWGTKRTSPKTGRRFYDMGQDNPVTCPDTGFQWVPEPVLKSKQTLPFGEAKPAADAEPVDTADLVTAELEIDADADEEETVDDAEEIGGDEDIGVPGEGSSDDQ